QELRSRELAGRNGRGVERKGLGVAPVCTFHGLAVPTISVRKQETHPDLERSLQICRKLRRNPLMQRPKFIPHFWHSRRSRCPVAGSSRAGSGRAGATQGGTGCA